MDFVELNSMKPVELESIALDTQVLLLFSISWSQDDKIYIIADKGVFIFELYSSPMCDSQTITFLKFWIPASSMMPLSDLIKDKSGFLWGLNRKDAYEAALDPALCYLVDKLHSSNDRSQIIQCEFSPLILGQSYLSCLTSHGLLEVYKYSCKKWSSIINITQLWMSYCNVQCDLKTINFDYIKNEIFKLTITSMKWFDKPEIIFLTANKSGTICIWNVDVYKSNITMNVRYCIQTETIPCTLGLNMISNTVTIILLVGFLSGLVKGFSLDLRTGNINKEITLWNDKDLIAPKINNIEVIDNILSALIVKRHILVISNLSVLNPLDIDNIKTVWVNFPSVISSINNWQNKFVLSLQNHNVYHLNIKDSELNYELSTINMDIKSKYKSLYHCYGMSMSKNRAIWIMVSSPKFQYDSLKEITNLTIYTTEIKTFKSLVSSSSLCLIEEISTKYNFTKLTEIFDLLELKRLELLLDDSKFKASFENDSNTTVLKLKLLLWEAKLKQYCHSTELDVAISNLEFLIAKFHAKEMLEKIEKIETLQTVQKQRLLKNYTLVLKSESRNFEIDNGFCLICNNKATSKNVKVSSCSKGHTFPLCCISFLPCTEVPYAVCQNCDSIASLNFVSEISRTCPFCDGILILNTQFSF